MCNQNRDALDLQLETLALQARDRPPGSPERKKYLEQLIRTIHNSGRKARPRGYPGYERAYDEMYNIALQRTYQYICEKIQNYDPDKGAVMAWFNWLLQRQFFWAFSEVRNPGRNRRWPGIPIIYIDDPERENTLEGIEQVPSSLSRRIVTLIEEDPEGLFRAKTMPSNSRVNFQWLALRRAEEYSWQEIEVETGSKISALSNFYQRSLREFRERIKELLSD